MKQRGIFEKVSSSGEWWIRYADATGRIRHEKVRKFDEAQTRFKLRKEEARLGGLPRLAWRRRPVSFRKIGEDALASPIGTNAVPVTTTFALENYLNGLETGQLIPSHRERLRRASRRKNGHRPHGTATGLYSHSLIV